jgi:adenosylcobinamide-phosphate synthase
VQVRESAIESLAENLNDSVVAPLFWFALLGLPGAALYRFANTADAMWGYPGMRGGRYWQWAGKWAARADDVLSWVPARITACCWRWSPGACRFPRWPARRARPHRPTAAGPWRPWPGPGSCADEPADTAQALRLCTRAAWLAVGWAVVLAAAVAAAAALRNPGAAA